MGIRDEMDGKFETGDSNLFQIWDEIQCVQTDFCFAQEIPAFYMSESWIKSARTVLDVGTGNGYFLKKISDLFPDKLYSGIDISKEFIGRAKQEHKDDNISYAVQNYFDVSECYDFLIMRLFWQHLPLDQLESALMKLEQITKKGSSVLICDAWDKVRVFEPDLPEFKKVIAAYTEHQSGTNRDRNIVERLLQEIAQNESWGIKSDLKIIIPSTVNDNLKLFRRVYDLWIRLFECLRNIEIDFTPAKKELEKWKQNKTAYTQAGLRIIQFDRL